jgi:hypothetical protein
MDFHKLNQPNKTPYIPIYTHRRYIGLLGFFLPIACIIIGWNENGLVIQRSISAYYHTSARDLFIAIMVVVSAFLLSYRGYNLRDRVITYISGFAAALTALFPTTISIEAASTEIRLGVLHLPEKLSGTLHLVSASILFAFFAVQSIFLFTKSLSRWRNIIYRICGITIVLSLIVLLVLFATDRIQLLHSMKIVFILEVIMLAAFGLAWVIKGKLFSKV